MDWQKSIADIDREIEALQRVRQSMVEASGGQIVRTTRVSSAGSQVIRLSARLRWAKKKGQKDVVKQLEKELEQAKAVLDTDKKSRKRA